MKKRVKVTVERNNSSFMGLHKKKDSFSFYNLEWYENENMYHSYTNELMDDMQKTLKDCFKKNSQSMVVTVTENFLHGSYKENDVLRLTFERYNEYKKNEKTGKATIRKTRNIEYRPFKNECYEVEKVLSFNSDAALLKEVETILKNTMKDEQTIF